MKKLILNCLLGFIPSSKWRKLIRSNFLDDMLPGDLIKYAIRSSYGQKHVYLDNDGADVIYNELCKDKPSLITRFGLFELEILKSFLDNKKRLITFGKDDYQAMSNNAGFFPANDYMLSRFASEMYEILANIDVLGVWFVPKEARVIPKYCPEKMRTVNISSIGDIDIERPWTRCLKGKKVLVIHPFAQTIKSQYEKRELLFKNPDVLPEFDLQVIKAVQSIADEKADLPFKTWFEALDFMKSQISQVDFDIALIGCGAYGMFLADYCKSIGKKAVHMGGATQLLFGIKGKRWDDSGIYNEHWVRPSENEIPKGVEKVEDGCYW